MRQPIAIWNPARGVWEVPQTESLLCEHLALYSGTWPTSGMTRNGQAFALPTSAPHTDDPESSSLPTPQASDWKGPNLSGSASQSANGLATVAAALLPTPDASAHKYRLGGDSQQSRSLEALARRGDLSE